MSSPSTPAHEAALDYALYPYSVGYIFDRARPPAPAGLALPPLNVVAEYRRLRDSWPRLLTPTLYNEMRLFVWPKASPGTEEAEPRWCRAWTALYNAVEEKEWSRLRWIRQGEFKYVEHLMWQMIRRPWHKFVQTRQEFLDGGERLDKRDEECLMLGILWRRYVRFEANRGVPDLETVHKRLESFGEDEKPSFAEREERAKNWTVMD